MSVLIIADIGSNHLGDLDRAINLIRECKWAGVDVAKFQYLTKEAFTNEEEWSKREEFALTASQLIVCAEACDRNDIEFMVTPTCAAHVEEMAPFVRRWKLGSADIHNQKLIDAILETGKPIIYSQGVAHDFPHHGIGLLCVAEYPAPPSKYPLGLKRNLGPEPIPWGLSDHTLTNTIAIASVALGACVIEKHIRSWHQPPSMDHAHSIHPGKFKELVDSIRELEKALANKTQPDGRNALMAKGRKVWS